jgi:uncharacterized protein (DUF1697 family)
VTVYVALLRGINVGGAKRLPMADLRAAVESLGYTSVATLLQSGNVVFSSEAAADAAALEDRIASATGVRAAVVLLTAAQLRTVAEENPLRDRVTDPSRATITFVEGATDASARPSDAELAPEMVVFGAHAVYQWCPDGISKSRLPARFFASLGPQATARNLRTVDKLLAMAEELDA